jgi:hypothetical protein
VGNTVHGFHHAFKDGIKEPARFLRIAIGDHQLHGALDIGEEDRHLLALPLERGLRGENPFGQVLGV